MLGVICTPKLAELAGDLSDGAACSESLAHRREEVLVRPGGPSHLGKSPIGRRLIALGANACRSLALASLDRGVDLEELDPVRDVLREAVHPDDDSLARLDLTLVAERGCLDLRLHPTLFDRGDGAAQIVDPRDQLRARCSRSSVSVSTK